LKENEKVRRRIPNVHSKNSRKRTVSQGGCAAKKKKVYR